MIYYAGKWVRRLMRRVSILLLFIGSWALQPAHAQMSGSTERSVSPFLGSVAEGEATSTPLKLSLDQAIQTGLRCNLGAVLSGERERGARGQRLVALSELLPEVDGHIRESSQQTNIAAFGFKAFPGSSSILGPFAVFDARGSVRQSILDLESLRKVQASAQNVKAAEYSYQDARSVVVLVVTSLYMQAIAGESRIESAQAQVALAQAAHKQALDRKNSGLLPAIDVLRAEVEEQAQQQRLIAYQNEFERQKLQLARAVGLPLGQQLELTDKLPYSPAAPPEFSAALAQAYQARMDYRSLQAQVKAAGYHVQSARATRLPTVEFRGDYGTIGESPASSHGTYSAAVTVDIPLFTGGKKKGETMEAESALAQQKAQLEDLRSRIAFEIRSALLDMNSAAQQVEVNRRAVELAARQEEQARDRFAAGVTDSLEVVQAQEALARAEDNLINSLYDFNLAHASLARATGEATANAGSGQSAPVKPAATNP